MALDVGTLWAKLKLDDLDFRKGLTRMRSSLVTAGKTVMKVGGALGKAFALGQAIQSVAGLVAVVGQLSGLLGALPGLLAVAAGAKIGLTLAAGNLQKALSGDKEALESLSPAARELYNEANAVKESFQSVRAASEKAFAGALLGQVKALGSTYMPTLRTGLAGVAGAWGQAFAGAAQAARSGAVVGAVKTALDSAKGSVNALGASFPALIQGFGASIGVGAPMAERLANAIGRVATQFGNWLTQAAKSGQLQAMINTAIATFQQLGSILSQVFGILGSVFSAMTTNGAGFLNIIETALASVNAFFKSAEGQEALKALFGAIGQTVKAIAPALGPLLSALGSIVKAVAPLLPVLGKLVAVVAKGLASAIKALAPAITEIVKALGPVLTPIIKALTPIFTALAPVIGSLGKLIATILVTALKALAPIFEKLLPVIAQLAAQLLPQLVPLIDALGGVVLALLPALLPLIDLLVMILIPIMKLVAALQTALMPVLKFLIVWLARIIGWVAKAIGWFIKFITAAKTWKAVGKFFADVWRTITNAFGTALNWIKDKWNALMAWFKSIPGKMRELGTSIVDGLVNGIKSVAGKIWDTAKSLVEKIPASIRKVMGIASPSKVTMRLGEYIGHGLVKGLTGTSTQIANAAVKLSKLIRDAFAGGTEKRLLGNLSVASKRLATLARQEVVVKERLKTATAALATLQNNAAKAAQDTAAKVMDAFKLVDESGGIDFESIKYRLTDALGVARQFASNMASLAKRGLAKDLLAQLAEAGPMAGGATADALAHMTDAQLKELSKLSTQLGAQAGKTGAVVSDALYGAGIRAAQGLVKGLQSQMGAIERMMMAIAKAMQASIRKALAIRSPSRKLAYLGAMTMKGFANGITKNALLAAKALDHAITRPSMLAGQRGQSNGLNSGQIMGMFSSALASVQGAGAVTLNAKRPWTPAEFDAWDRRRQISLRGGRAA